MKWIGAFWAVTLVLSAASPEFDQAQKLYELTEFEQSLKLLKAIPVKDGPVYALMGRNYFMNADYKKATDALERAVAADPNNSDYALWLGRAYGRRAEISNPFSAIGHANKTRQYLERAVQLNPRNIDALNDLLEYYMDAPGFMGGGMDKARATVARIAEVDPAEGPWAQAMLDERRKEYGSAEAHLRRAIDMAPHQAGRVIELAKFLSKQGRYQESDQSFARAEQLAPDSPELMYAKADAYIKAGRRLKEAKELLEHYLSTTVSPDDPPKADARKLLRQIQGG